jgi:hypothetical protein
MFKQPFALSTVKARNPPRHLGGYEKHVRYEKRLIAGRNVPE